MEYKLFCFEFKVPVFSFPGEHERSIHIMAGSLNFLFCFVFVFLYFHFQLWLISYANQVSENYPFAMR